ncbi:MAG: GHKL domain-containing protein [Syntrophomonas sp.]
MSHRRIWIFTLLALLLSLFFMKSIIYTRTLCLSDNPAAQIMSGGWDISDGEKTLFKNAAFLQTGSLKNQHRVVLSKTLPATHEQSLCFISIGYAVQVFINGSSVYTFDSSLNSPAVWGVKTHLFKIPDGTAGRVIKLELATNHPGSIAVSKHVLLDDGLAILSALTKSALMDIIFSLFYICIGLFLLIFAFISITFRYSKFNFSILMLALIAFFIGISILFNVSVLAYYTGPVFVYWIVNIANMTIPIWVLIFVAADRGLKKSRLLLVMAGTEAIYLGGWIIGNLFHWDLFFLNWNLPLNIILAIVLAATFIREFRRGAGRPYVVAAVTAILLASGLDAYIYFTEGNYYSMNYNLIITAFPVLVLMTGKTALNSIQREYRILNENATLRVEGDILHKNYIRTEEYIEETKQIWHDIDKHFAVISNLAAADEYAELKHYLQDAGYDFKKTKAAYLCENKLINAILSDKFAEAEGRGIKVGFAGNLPDQLQIQGNDLCSLLVNLLDNAIEACDKVTEGKEKRIDISIRMKNDFIFFGVANSSPGAPLMLDEDFVSSKAEPEKHGYGISIIQKIARKYDGAFDVIHSQDSFLVKVALKNAPAGGSSISEP